jgi:hypothetical protein
MERATLRDQYEAKVTDLIQRIEEVAEPSSTPRVFNEHMKQWADELKDIRYYIQSTETPEK